MQKNIQKCYKIQLYSKLDLNSENSRALSGELSQMVSL